MEAVILCPISNKVLSFNLETRSWFVMVGEQRYLIGGGDTQSVVAVLPFLEFDIDLIRGRVAEILQSCSDLHFPYDFFVRAGFQHGSPHWVESSLQWLWGLEGLEVNFHDELESVVQNRKRYSQKSRHLAQKLLKRSNSEIG
jgi:hypothetical protein